MCKMDGCEKPIFTKLSGLCSMHYTRLRVHGDPNIAPRTPKDKPLSKRIEDTGWAVDENTGCWNWLGNTDWCGYPIIKFRNREIRVHRWSLEQKLGRPIPPKHMACHTCDNPTCMNPDHLFLGTQEDNMRDMKEKGRGRRGGSALSEEKVRQIRRMYRSGGYTQAKIESIFGLSGGTVCKVMAGKIWAWVAD